MNPKLSIIITCYNLGNYLQEAIDSIKSFQPSTDIEIILVNDGSTDELTNAIIKNILEKDNNIIYLNQPNLGLAKARNNGMKMASAAYIIPLDADNKLRSEFIKQTITILDNNPDVDVVHGNAQMFGNKSTLWKGKPFCFPEILLNNYIDACAGFRKSTWEKVGRYDENMPIMGFEDWDLWIRMGITDCKFQYVDEIFFDYRVRDNSMLSDAWQKRQDLMNYIFSKKETKHLAVFRQVIIENKKLKEEPSFNFLIQTIFKKIKRKFNFK